MPRPTAAGHEAGGPHRFTPRHFMIATIIRRCAAPCAELP
jgi:hypothetical protein